LIDFKDSVNLRTDRPKDKENEREREREREGEKREDRTNGIKMFLKLHR